MIIHPQFPAGPTAPEERKTALRAGVNTLLAATPFGFVISGAAGGESFRHPFQVTPAGRGGVQIARGLVDGLEPRVGNVPVSGDRVKGLPPPTLRLDPSEANTRRESWVCVEVVPTSDGELADATGAPASGVKIEIAHRSAPTRTGPVGRHPLALIVWGAKGPARVFQVTHFNLRYFRTAPSTEKPLRHYFF